MKNYNFSAMINVELTDKEFKALDSELNKHKVYGHRGLGGF